MRGTRLQTWAVGALWLCGGCVMPRAAHGLKSVDAEAFTDRVAVGASTLGSGDLVEIRVFQESDLSGAWRLSPEGLIDYPLCGNVSLNGKTSIQASEAIAACLANGFLKNPQVSLVIREFNSKKVFVFGEVQKPGTFPFDENMSVVQAITLAGGFTKQAAKNSTNVTRLMDGREQKVRVPVEDIGVGKEKNFLLKPGDIVFVPESFF